MIGIRLGTRAGIAGQLVGASNLDVGTYQDASGASLTGLTMTLTIPDAPAAIVGRGSLVRIGEQDYLVDEVVVGETAADCEVRLVPVDEVNAS